MTYLLYVIVCNPLLLFQSSLGGRERMMYVLYNCDSTPLVVLSLLPLCPAPSRHIHIS